MNLNINKVEDQRILRGHSAPVVCLAVDWGRWRMVSGSEDGSLRFWDLVRGTCLQELTGHTEGVLCAALELEDFAEDASTPLASGATPDADLLAQARRDAGVPAQIDPSLDLALHQLAKASSAKEPLRGPWCAVDGNPETRWTSEYADGQWLAVDLGEARVLSHVEVRWEAAYAETYTLHRSTDGTTWTTMATERGRKGWVVTKLPRQSPTRWVRVYGQKRATQFGFSIWDFRVYAATDLHGS